MWAEAFHVLRIQGETISAYLYRWPNGDISLVSGRNRLAIDEVLDEVGNPDGAEMIRIKHGAAVHLHSKEKMAPILRRSGWSSTKIYFCQSSDFFVRS